MAIGLLLFRRRVTPVVMISLAIIFLALRTLADDQIVKTDDNTISGQIISVVGDQVIIQTHDDHGGMAKFPLSLAMIKTVHMAVPAEVAQAEAPGATPSSVVAALQPKVDKFAGLPTPWVVDAMGQLAQAYIAVGQPEKALATYNQIDTLYPGSKYHAQAVAGKAAMSLKAGKIDEALAAVQPIIAQANKDLAPSPEDGATYANAFLVYGAALNAQKKPQQALEAYLTVKTMFYQNANLVDEADQRVKDLREHNPGIGVE